MSTKLLLLILRNKFWYVLFIVFGLFVITACTSPSASEVQLSSSTGGGEVVMQSGVTLPKQDKLESSSPSQNDPVESGDDKTSTIEEEIANSVEPVEELVDAMVEEPEGEITNDNSPPSENESLVPDTEPVDLPIGVQVGNLAPEFGLQTPEGELINLSDLRGKPVIVSYWTSWCAPCKNEMQILEKVYQQYQDQGVIVVAVNAIEQDSLGAVSEMINQLGLTYLIVLDHGNRFADDYHALFFPTTYFLDHNGVIMDVALGDSPEDQFIARVTRFLENQ